MKYLNVWLSSAFAIAAVGWVLNSKAIQGGASALIGLGLLASGVFGSGIEELGPEDTPFGRRFAAVVTGAVFVVAGALMISKS